MGTRTVIKYYLLFFPLFYAVVLFWDFSVRKLFIPFGEEMFGRILPILLAYAISLHGTSKVYLRTKNLIELGIFFGLIYGFTEMVFKIMILNIISPLMLIPILCVHIINSVIDSVILYKAVSEKQYCLIPLSYIVCTLWHLTYNVVIAGFY